MFFATLCLGTGFIVKKPQTDRYKEVMIDRKHFSGLMSVLFRGALAMVLGVCVLQAAADSYKRISEWPGTMRGEPFAMKPHGDYLYASMNGQGILNVMDAGTVDGSTICLNVGRRIPFSLHTFTFLALTSGLTLRLMSIFAPLFQIGFEARWACIWNYRIASGGCKSFVALCCKNI